MADQHDRTMPSRRAVMAKGAAGAAVLWTLPVLTSIPAAAQQGSTAGGPGTFLFTFGTLGFDPGQFVYPFGVAVDSTGRIIVTDTYNNRIQIFDELATRPTEGTTHAR